NRVETHAAAGYRGDLFGRRQTRSKNQPQRLLFAEKIISSDQTRFDRLAANLGLIDPSAVVGNRNNRSRPFEPGFELDLPAGVLPGQLSLGCGLQPVIDGVAQHVIDRVGHSIYYHLVQLSLTTS